jgi:hypothetical protein
MKRIIIAGAGQIGSRHLQGLLLSRHDMEIEIAEPLEANRKLAMEKALQVVKYGEKKITFVNSADLLSSEPADLAIIATNSDVRAEVVSMVLSRTSVKYLILEKVVYQSVREFDSQIGLIEKAGTMAWVNCPRRVYPFYLRLKEETGSPENFFMTVSGSNWGLACNSVHFIDLFYYLTAHSGDHEVKAIFNPGFIESKRSGYMEYTGDLLIAGNKSGLLLRSFRNGGIPVHTDISVPGCRYVISESAGYVVKYSESNKFKPELEEVKFPFQSELTGIYADSLFDSGRCSLTPLAESRKYHNILFDALGQHIMKESGRLPEKYSIT